jgi:molybdopterin converting factor small subunit
LPERLTLPDGASLDDALESLVGQLADARLLPPSCLISVSGQHLGTVADHSKHTLRDGDELVLIAPVAGG